MFAWDIAVVISVLTFVGFLFGLDVGSWVIRRNSNKLGWLPIASGAATALVTLNVVVLDYLGVYRVMVAYRFDTSGFHTAVMCGVLIWLSMAGMIGLNRRQIANLFLLPHLPSWFARKLC